MDILITRKILRAGLKFPRSNAAGGYPRQFIYMEKCLSIFIDESGDFGKYDKNSPYYLVTFLFHDQSNDISARIDNFENHLTQIGYKGHYLHTGPLIRRESVYEYMIVDERARILNSFMRFAISLPIAYRTFIVKKKEGMQPFSLISELSRQIQEFLFAHSKMFEAYDKIIV